MGYKYIKEDEFIVGVSLENPNGNIFRNQNTTRPQVYPDLVGKFIKIWGENHLQVAGIFRTFVFKNTITGEEKITGGYGVNLSGRAQVLNDLNFYSQIAFGAGIGDYIALDYVLIESGGGDYSTPQTLSGVAGFNYIINYLFNILPSLKTGGEIIYGHSTNIAGASGNAARFYLMFQFDF